MGPYLHPSPRPHCKYLINSFPQSELPDGNRNPGSHILIDLISREAFQPLLLYDLVWNIKETILDAQAGCEMNMAEET